MNARIWLGLHALVAVLPALAMLCHAPDARLFGSEVSPGLPALTVAGWRSEKVQPAFQAWFETRIGLRGVMVRADSTVQVYGLGQAKPSGRVFVGRDDTLFVDDDIFSMSRPEEDLPAILASIDALAERLAAVQTKLAARGKKLVVVLSPSKTVIYPEAVPPGYRRGTFRADIILHEGIRARFERHQVSFADGDALLSGKTGVERDLVFARRGRHWTALGACLVVREALAGGSVTPSCAYEMQPAEWEVDDDFDLYRLVNMWQLGAPPALVPRLVQRGRPDAASTTARPRALFVGTSFMWKLVDALRPFVDAPIAFYYNQTVYDVSETRRAIEPVNPDSPRWAEYALERDLYVVEILEPYAHGDDAPKFLETLEGRLR